MKRITFILLLLVLILALMGCEQTVSQKAQLTTNSTEITTTGSTETLLVPTETEESTQNDIDDLSAETYTLYYFYADASYVGIAGFKNSEDQSIEDFLIEGYNLKEYKQPGNYEIVIPETIDGRTVCNIDMKAFDNCDSIVSVTIPECCTNIEAGVFTYGCRDDIIIYGTKGSATEKHAQEYKLTFVEIK